MWIAALATLVGAWALYWIGKGATMRQGMGGPVALILGATVVAVPFVVVYVIYSITRRRPLDRHWQRLRDLLRRRGPMTAALVLGLGLVSGIISGNGTHETIVDYCAYGAVSAAQFDGCVDHVTLKDIDRLNTPAAMFSRHEIGCGEDAGPFCANRDYIDTRSNPWD